MSEDQELEQVFQSLADYFGLLAEPTRLKILHCLCERERHVNDVVEQTGLTQATTSRHLNMLYRAGIVDRRKDGASVYYRVVDPNFATICRTVCVQIASGEPHRSLRRPSRASLLKLSKALQAPVE